MVGEHGHTAGGRADGGTPRRRPVPSAPRRAALTESSSHQAPHRIHRRRACTCAAVGRALCGRGLVPAIWGAQSPSDLAEGVAVHAALVAHDVSNVGAGAEHRAARGARRVAPWRCGRQRERSRRVVARRDEAREIEAHRARGLLARRLGKAKLRVRPPQTAVGLVPVALEERAYLMTELAVDLGEEAAAYTMALDDAGDQSSSAKPPSPLPVERDQQRSVLRRSAAADRRQPRASLRTPWVPCSPTSSIPAWARRRVRSIVRVWHDCCARRRARTSWNMRLRTPQPAPAA